MLSQGKGKVQGPPPFAPATTALQLTSIHEYGQDPAVFLCPLKVLT
jgi:hypothetical protein